MRRITEEGLIHMIIDLMSLTDTYKFTTVEGTQTLCFDNVNNLNVQRRILEYLQAPERLRLINASTKEGKKIMSCINCKNWERFQSNKNWGTCKRIHFPEDKGNEDYIAFETELDQCLKEAWTDLVVSTELETNKDFFCKLWEEKKEGR